METHVPDRPTSTSAAAPEHGRGDGKALLDADAVSRTLSRIAHEVIERNPDLSRVALVGLRTRGVPLAARLHRLVAERAGVEVGLGSIDVTPHRDDARSRPSVPVVRATSVPFALEGATVILVDDVLYTGRTIRAAIDALVDIGRPDRVQLFVLVDRGHRELPIRPDYVGKNVPTSRDERVQVELEEVDGIDRVVLLAGPEETHG